MNDIRLNKYLSDADFCTRREADEFIHDNRVTVNGKLALTGSKVSIDDEVRVDGEKVTIPKHKLYSIINGGLTLEQALAQQEALKTQAPKVKKKLQTKIIHTPEGKKRVTYALDDEPTKAHRNKKTASGKRIGKSRVDRLNAGAKKSRGSYPSTAKQKK